MIDCNYCNLLVFFPDFRLKVSVTSFNRTALPALQISNCSLASRLGCTRHHCSYPVHRIPCRRLAPSLLMVKSTVQGSLQEIADASASDSKPSESSRPESPEVEEHSIPRTKVTAESSETFAAPSAKRAKLLQQLAKVERQVDGANATCLQKPHFCSNSTAVLQITDLEAGLVSSSDPAYSIFKGKNNGDTATCFIACKVRIHNDHVCLLQAIPGCCQATSARWLINFLIQCSLIPLYHSCRPALQLYAVHKLF